MKKIGIILFGVILTFSFMGKGFANPFENGGFEDGPVITGGFVVLYAGSTEIDGWTVELNSIDLIGDYWTPSEGSRSIDLNGDAIGAIFQTFDTIPDQWYQVQFDMAGNPGGEQGEKILLVNTDTMAQEYEFDSTGSGTANMNWAEKVFVFQAATDSTTLQFSSIAPDNVFGPAIDNVQVTKIPRPFPEDSMHPMGAVHAYNNVLWPPNNKKVKVKIAGYVRDELSIARDGEGDGVSEAYLLINNKKIILKNSEINRFDENGKFSIVTKLRAKKGKKYQIKLFAADTVSDENGGPNIGLVDSTRVVVPKNMKTKAKKKKKKEKKKKK